MAGFSTTVGGLNFQYPNRGTVNWDAVVSNTFTTISSHDHNRDTAGRGKVLNDRSILATNTGWFQATDFAGTGTVNLIRANTSNLIELGANVASLDVTGNITIKTNSTYLKGRNAADSADVEMFKVNASNYITAAQDLTVLGEVSLEDNADWFKGRNAADNAYVNLVRASTGDLVEIGKNLDVKTNSIVTTTTDGDIVLTPNGTGRVQLGSSRVENAVGAAGEFLMSDGASASDWAIAGWEQIDSDEISTSTASVIYNLSDYSTVYKEFVCVMDSVGGTAASWPSFSVRTAAAGAISCNFIRSDTTYSNIVSNNIYGNLDAGAGTAKRAFLHVKLMTRTGGTATFAHTNFEGWFINTTGTDMGVFGTAKGVIGQIVAFNGTGSMTSGSIHLYARRA